VTLEASEISPVRLWTGYMWCVRLMQTSQRESRGEAAQQPSLTQCPALCESSNRSILYAAAKRVEYMIRHKFMLCTTFGITSENMPPSRLKTDYAVAT